MVYQPHYPHTMYHGTHVYPEMLLEADIALELMKQVSLLDSQTSRVAIATLIYTQEVEIYTSLTVSFHVSNAGDVEPHVQLVSFHEMHGAELALFWRLMLTSAVTSFLAFLWTARRYLQSSCTRRGDQLRFKFSDYYELVGRAVTHVFVVGFLVTYSSVEMMSHEFDEALHVFADMPHFSPHELEDVMKHFFEVMEHVYHTAQWAA